MEPETTDQDCSILVCAETDSAAMKSEMWTTEEANEKKFRDTGKHVGVGS